MSTANSPSSWSESRSWSSFPGGWVPLGGSFEADGFSLEWHDFKTGKSFDWGRTFHPHSVEVCLNLEGTATLWCNGDSTVLKPGFLAVYSVGFDSLHAERASGQRHRFLTVELAPAFLREHLAREASFADPVVAPVLREPKVPSAVGRVETLTSRQREFVTSLLSPPVSKAAQGLWHRGKVLEFMAEVLMTQEEAFFCSRQKRVARERVDRVIALLRRDLENPPTLEQLGRLTGCSHFHLSRTFSQEMGMTIPQFLRQIRIERAADLLASGNHNVTEVAIQVGYNSVSHFSQAFCQLMGTCPTLYQGRRRREEHAVGSLAG